MAGGTVIVVDPYQERFFTFPEGNSYQADHKLEAGKLYKLQEKQFTPGSPAGAWEDYYSYTVSGDDVNVWGIGVRVIGGQIQQFFRVVQLP